MIIGFPAWAVILVATVVTPNAAVLFLAVLRAVLRDRQPARKLIMNNRKYKVTGTMRQVLAVIVDAPEAAPAWGLSICESTGLGVAKVYPALDRLMKAGLIRDEWEDPAPESRPRRRLYHGSYARFWYEANHLLDPWAAS